MRTIRTGRKVSAGPPPPLSSLALIGLAILILPLLGSCRNPGTVKKGEPGKEEPELAAVEGARLELFRAAEAGELERVRQLVEKEPSLVRAEDPFGWTALSYAAWAGQKGVYDYLTARGAATSLFTEAALGPFPAFVEKLRARPASVRDRDPRQRATPLAWAVRAGNVTGCEFLLSMGADVDAPDRFGDTPLHLAVRGGKAELSLFLIQAGANVNLANKKGQSPLHLAASAGAVELCELLIDRGAAVDAADGEGNTPLHLAAAEGRFEAGEYLLARGAAVSLKNGRGLTPLQLAARNGHEQVVRLLKAQGGI